MSTSRRADVDLCVVVCGGQQCQGCDADLVEQLGPVIASTSGGVLLRSECLRPCRKAPVVVVQRRVPDARFPVTVALSPAEPTEQHALESWVRDGGPGVAPMPPALDPCVFSIT